MCSLESLGLQVSDSSSGSSLFIRLVADLLFAALLIAMPEMHKELQEETLILVLLEGWSEMKGRLVDQEVALDGVD